jgi:hypothetical protein
MVRAGFGWRKIMRKTPHNMEVREFAADNTPTLTESELDNVSGGGLLRAIAVWYDLCGQMGLGVSYPKT